MIINITNNIVCVKLGLGYYTITSLLGDLGHGWWAGPREILLSFLNQNKAKLWTVAKEALCFDAHPPTVFHVYGQTRTNSVHLKNTKTIQRTKNGKIISLLGRLLLISMVCGNRNNSNRPPFSTYIFVMC